MPVPAPWQQNIFREAVIQVTYGQYAMTDERTLCLCRTAAACQYAAETRRRKWASLRHLYIVNNPHIPHNREIYRLGSDITGKNSDLYVSLFKEYPDVVTVEQMSEMLGISTKTAYQLLKDNKIEHFKIGRIYKIPKFHILTYLNIIQGKT